jgi:uncharacterized glyoxalase superfamily protein PhnB
VSDFYNSLSGSLSTFEKNKNAMEKSFETPDYYNTVMPYLILKDVSKFIAFVSAVFGAKEKMRYRDDDGRVVHAEVTIGENVIMAGESTDQWATQTAGLYINVDDADKIYQKALDEGATTVMEVSDKEYGRSGGIKDPCGNTWWITGRQ